LSQSTTLILAIEFLYTIPKGLGKAIYCCCWILNCIGGFFGGALIGNHRFHLLRSERNSSILTVFLVCYFTIFINACTGTILRLYRFFQFFLNFFISIGVFKIYIF
jgi:hypothetical protein